VKIENISLIIYLCVENVFSRGSILMLVEVAVPSNFFVTLLHDLEIQQVKLHSHNLYLEGSHHPIPYNTLVVKTTLKLIKYGFF
jgi:hypothetical protein